MYAYFNNDWQHVRRAQCARAAARGRSARSGSRPSGRFARAAGFFAAGFLAAGFFAAGFFGAGFFAFVERAVARRRLAAAGGSEARLERGHQVRHLCRAPRPRAAPRCPRPGPCARSGRAPARGTRRDTSTGRTPSPATRSAGAPSQARGRLRACRRRAARRGGRTATSSSANSIVSMVSTSPAGRIAVRYSLERSTTRAIATLLVSRSASSSSLYALAAPVSGTR